MRIVTPNLIKRYNPCDSAQYFYNKFPEGTEITVELCIEHASRIEWEWVAMRLLSKAKRVEYTKAVQAIQEYHRKLLIDCTHPSIPAELRAEYAASNFAVASLEAALKQVETESKAKYIDSFVAASKAFQSGEKQAADYYAAVLSAVESMASGGAEGARIQQELTDARSKRNEIKANMSDHIFRIADSFNAAMKIVYAAEFALAWLTETDEEWIAKLDAKNAPRVDTGGE